MKFPGEQFLHQQDSRLHLSPPVEHEKARKKRSGERVSDKPAEKISSFMEVLERTHLGHRDDPEVMRRLKASYHGKHIIKPADVPESYFENQRRIARELGHGDIVIDEQMRRELIATIRRDQAATMDAWFDYFTSHDSDSFPMWAKYWAWNGMLGLSTYDKKKHAYWKRTKDTVAPFPDLNREALAYVVDSVVKKANGEQVTLAAENPEFARLLKDAGFGKLYAWAIEEVTPEGKNELQETAGAWVTYPKGSDHMPLVASLQGHATGWCTAGESTARSQLDAGDFHVYYSLDRHGNATVPRIAIRMQESSIAEVRGIADSQNLDSVIMGTDILETKLKTFGTEGDKYRKRSADMRRMTELCRKEEAGEDFTTEDLRFLYGLDGKIEGFGYGDDPRVDKLKNGRNEKRDFSIITGFKEDEISTKFEDILQGGKRCHVGSLAISMEDNPFEPKEDGDVFDGDDFYEVDDAEHDYRESAYYEYDYWKVGRYAELPWGFRFPEVITEDLKILCPLDPASTVFPKDVGGDFMTNTTSLRGATLPERVGGSVYLNRLVSGEGLALPSIIGGDIHLATLMSAEGITFPERIRGSLQLPSLMDVKGLRLPRVMDGLLSLDSLDDAHGLVIPQGKCNLYLPNLVKAEGLDLPDEFDGSLSLNSLYEPKGLRLSKRIAGNLILDGLTTAEGLVLPESIGGGLTLNGLASPKGLVLPESVGGGIWLESLRSAEGLTFPSNLGGLYLHGLTTAKGLILPRVLKGDLDISKLTSPEGLVLPDSIMGSLDLQSLRSLNGVTIPEGAREIKLQGLQTAKGFNLPESFHGSVWVEKLRNKDINRLRRRYRNVQWHIIHGKENWFKPDVW